MSNIGRKSGNSSQCAYILISLGLINIYIHKQIENAYATTIMKKKIFTSVIQKVTKWVKATPSPPPAHQNKQIHIKKNF